MTAETGELFAPEPAIAAAGLAVLDDGEPDVDRALELIDAAWRRGLEAEPQLTVSEWADRHRVLPTANAEPGPWRTDRVPYLREIMDALSTSLPIERVVFMNGAQTGGTAAALNAIGYWIAHAPGIILTVWPSIDMVRRNSRIRIEPLIDGTPALRAKIPPARSKDPGNAVAQKEFPGGALVMTGANSAAGLRSLPARYLVLDEVDAFPPDADGEGDPVALAVQRTVTFRGRRKIVLISTPTFAGASRIETAFAESDQRRFFVPCPHCGAMQLIAWSSIQWPEARPREAFMACEANGCVIEERDKPKMLSHGEWRATAGGDGRTAGFHLPALYSPFESWADIAAEFLTVRRDPLRLQPWTNTKLGLPFENSEGGQFEAAKALERLEDWGDGLPEHAAVITAGVDVQGDRLAVSPGARERSSWSLDYSELWGDPAKPDVWRALDHDLMRRFDHPRAGPMPVRAVCVDSGGHWTQQVYRFARERAGRCVWAIKGRGGPGIPVWPRRPPRPAQAVFTPFILGVDAAKELIVARFDLEDGPGRCHWPIGRDLDYFQMLGAERIVRMYRRGVALRVWKKDPALRNEALDCRVYGYAALCGWSPGASGSTPNRGALRKCRCAKRPRRNRRRPERRSFDRAGWMDNRRMLVAPIPTLGVDAFGPREIPLHGFIPVLGHPWSPQQRIAFGPSPSPLLTHHDASALLEAAEKVAEFMKRRGVGHFAFDWRDGDFPSFEDRERPDGPTAIANLYFARFDERRDVLPHLGDARFPHGADPFLSLTPG